MTTAKISHFKTVFYAAPCTYHNPHVAYWPLVQYG